MTDTFNVTAAYDKSSYNQGDTFKISISGNDVLTTTTVTQQQMNCSFQITAADGATETVTAGPVTVNVTTVTSTQESVRITGATDSQGRTLTIDPSGLFVTGVA